MNIKDEIYPKVKADVRMINDKTLWVKVSKPEFEKIGRIILEDGSVFCKVFYQDAEPERKTGKWIYVQEEHKYMCSSCHARIDKFDKFKSFFCYHCGADMRGKDDGN